MFSNVQYITFFISLFVPFARATMPTLRQHHRLRLKQSKTKDSTYSTYKICYCRLLEFLKDTIETSEFSIIYYNNKFLCTFCSYCKTAAAVIFILIQYYVPYCKNHCVQLLFSIIMFVIVILLKSNNKPTYKKPIKHIKLIT
jgi:hypothetical protein